MGPKKKQEKMSIGAFLGDATYGSTSWADEMDDMPIPSGDSRSGYGSERREYSKPSFGGDRDRGFDSERNFQPREQLPLPTKPPYTAHLGNLSFDVTQNDIQDFFKECEVTNVRIVEDKLDRKPKGFGYVEFGTLDGLKKALELNSTQFQGRNVRISVAEPPKDRAEGRELNDWSRKGPLPDLPSAQRRPSERNFSRQGDAGSDFGSERNLSRRGSNFGAEGDGKTRDFANWERRGPLSPLSPAPSAGRGEGDARRNDKSFERRGSPASWGEGREPGAFRPPRESREFSGAREPREPRGERPPPVERAPTAADQDSQWRAKMRPDAPPTPVTATPDASVPSSPAAAPSAPASRQRLNLQKRTVSEAPPADAADARGDGGDAKASPFGAARPIDTTARDKQIEEKRLAMRLKKEEEDKAAQEKRAAEKAEKQAKGEKEKVTSPAGRQPKPQVPAQGGPEDLDTSSKPRNYEILRRMADENGEGAAPVEGEGDMPSANTNGTMSDDKTAKPEETVQDAADGSAEAMADDGFTVVAKSGKKGRGGSRAPAL